MANIIIKSGNYLNESAVYNTINYVYASEHVTSCGAVGVLWYPSLRRCCTDKVLEEGETDSNMEFLANSFKAVKAAYDKTDGQQVVHIVVGFDKKDFMTPTLAYLFAEQFSHFIGRRFQVIYGVHEGSIHSKSYLHIHFVINTVSYIDGNRFYDKRSYYYELAAAAKKMMPNLQWNVYKC